MADKEKSCAVVIGASGGIGRALTEILARSDQYSTIYALSRSGKQSDQPRVRTGFIDITDESSIKQAAEQLDSPPALLVIATGLLSHKASPEKSIKALDADTAAHLFAVNTIGPALVAKHFMPKFAKDRRAVFAAISARVGSIEDNQIGGWYSYRSSKAALNQMIRCLAIEFGRSHKQAICAGLHPGTVDTALSKPFQGNVRPEKLFTAERSAGDILQVLDGLTPADSGQLFAYDGSVIPF